VIWLLVSFELSASLRLSFQQLRTSDFFNHTSWIERLHDTDLGSRLVLIPILGSCNHYPWILIWRASSDWSAIITHQVPASERAVTHLSMIAALLLRVVYLPVWRVGWGGCLKSNGTERRGCMGWAFVLYPLIPYMQWWTWTVFFLRFVRAGKPSASFQQLHHIWHQLPSKNFMTLLLVLAMCLSYKYSQWP